MALRYNNERKGSQIESDYKAADFRNVVDIGPIYYRLRTEDLKAGLEPECGVVLDVQFWTTIGTKRLHAFVTFSSSGGATAALKGYIPPIWWGDGKKPQITRFNHPQDLKNYKPVFQSRSDQKNPPRSPSLRVSTTSAPHSTSTSPSTAPIDTPVSTCSAEKPSCALPYSKNSDQSIPSLPRGTRPTAAPIRKESPTDSKIALGEVDRDGSSKGEEHNQFRCTRTFNPTAKSGTSNRESGKGGEGLRGRSSIRASSDGQAKAIGEPFGISPRDPPTQISSGKGAGQSASRAQVDDLPSLEANVAETKARIEELKATRETLDKERNELTSKKETLRGEIAYYVKVKSERSKLSLRTAPAQSNCSRTAPTPPKDAEAPTSILSALFLLHSIAISDTAH